MSGYGINPDAPEFPLVIPTMLLRPFRPLWRPLLNTASTFVHFAWHSLADFFDQETVMAPEEIAKRIVEEVVQEAGGPDDWDMMNDEVL